MTDIIITDNSEEVISEFNERLRIALEEVGREAEGNAKQYCTAVDTGRLRNSIAFATSEHYGSYDYTDKYGLPFTDESEQPEKNSVYIGSNVEYAPYIELGHAVTRHRPVKRDNRKRQHDESHAKTVAPLHFLKNAIANHTERYMNIIKTIMEGQDGQE